MTDGPAILIEFADKKEFFSFLAGSLAADCMFLKTTELYPQGTVLSLELTSEKDGALLSGSVEVLWEQQADPNEPTASTGLGLKFVELTPQSKEHLQQYLSETSLHYMPTPELLATQARIEESAASKKPPRKPGHLAPPPSEQSSKTAIFEVGRNEEKSQDLDEVFDGLADKMGSTFSERKNAAEATLVETPEEPPTEVFEFEPQAAPAPPPPSRPPKREPPKTDPSNDLIFDEEVSAPKKPFASTGPGATMKVTDDDLDEIEAAADDSFEGEPEIYRPQKKSGRNLWPLIGAVVVLALAVAVMVWLLITRKGPGAPPEMAQAPAPVVQPATPPAPPVQPPVPEVQPPPATPEAPAPPTTPVEPPVPPAPKPEVKTPPPALTPATPQPPVAAVTPAPAKPVPAPPAAAPAGKTVLIGIDGAAQGANTIINLRASGTLGKYHAMDMKSESPLRLVIDFPGLESQVPGTQVAINSPVVQQVRQGKHPDKLRIVVDFKGKVYPKYTLDQEGAALKISVSAP